MNRVVVVPIYKLPV